MTLLDWLHCYWCFIHFCCIRKWIWLDIHITMITMKLSTKIKIAYVYHHYYNPCDKDGFGKLINRVLTVLSYLVCFYITQWLAMGMHWWVSQSPLKKEYQNLLHPSIQIGSDQSEVQAILVNWVWLRDPSPCSGFLWHVYMYGDGL